MSLAACQRGNVLVSVAAVAVRGGLPVAFENPAGALLFLCVGKVLEEALLAINFFLERARGEEHRLQENKERKFIVYHIFMYLYVAISDGLILLENIHFYQGSMRK